MIDCGDDKPVEIKEQGGEIIIQEKSTMDYLTFTAQQAGSTIGMQHYGTNTGSTKPHIDYQINDGEWVTEWNGDSTITLQNAGDYVKMKGHNESGFSRNSSNFSEFTMTGKITANGNIMSLIDAEKDGTKVIPCDYCFCYLFNNCTGLVTAPSVLPATTLASFCYYSMFSDCTSLVNAPELPAETYVSYAYAYMFYNCKSITSLPNFNLQKSIIFYTGDFRMLSCGDGGYTGSLQTIKCGEYINTYDGSSRSFSITLTNGTTWYLEMWTNSSCFLPGTQITLADNTTKAIEDITYDDDILVWNADEGKLDSAKPVWLTRSGLHNDHYYKLTFSDGTVLKVTGTNSNHKMYDMNQQKFVGCAYAKPGDRIYSLNGIVTVVSNEYVEENVEYYNIQTDQHINCFAEGILTSDRYGNLYPHDENMKYVKDGRAIRPYSEFEAAGISQYWYDHLRMGESNESVEDAAKYVRRCESQMLPLPTE